MCLPTPTLADIARLRVIVRNDAAIRKRAIVILTPERTFIFAGVVEGTPVVTPQMNGVHFLEEDFHRAARHLEEVGVPCQPVVAEMLASMRWPEFGTVSLAVGHDQP